MVDNLSPADRRKCMGNVRNRDTTPEMLIRRQLHRRGLRYRLHRKDIPGTPDIAFISARAVIFVHGCFWHGHNCSRGKVPAARTRFWEDKQNRNRTRDAESLHRLDEKGWRYAVIWECALSGPRRWPLKELTTELIQWLKGDDKEAQFEGIERLNARAGENDDLSA